MNTNTSRERYHFYHRGWKDGAARKLQRPEFVNHATRPDLTKEYLKGYAAGEKAIIKASASAAKRLRYVPEILREDK